MAYDDSLKTPNFIAGVSAAAIVAVTLTTAVTISSIRSGNEDTERLSACVASGQQWSKDAAGQRCEPSATR